MKRTLVPLPAPLISAALLEPSRFLTRPQLLTCLVPLPVGGAAPQGIICRTPLDNVPKVRPRSCGTHRIDIDTAGLCAHAMTTRVPLCLSLDYAGSRRSESICRR
jgi:hypothetical protein